MRLLEEVVRDGLDLRCGADGGYAGAHPDPEGAMVGFIEHLEESVLEGVHVEAVVVEAELGDELAGVPGDIEGVLLELIEAFGHGRKRLLIKMGCSKRGVIIRLFDDVNKIAIYLLIIFIL